MRRQFVLADRWSLSANRCELHPAVEGWLVPGRNPFGLYLYAENVDELAEDRPLGMYEFARSDPDKTLVRVGWPRNGAYLAKKKRISLSLGQLCKVGRVKFMKPLTVVIIISALAAKARHPPRVRTDAANEKNFIGRIRSRGSARAIASATSW